MNQHTPERQLQSLINHLEGAYAPNTLRAYRADMLEFMEFAARHGQMCMPYTPQMVQPHLLESAKTGIKTSTIKRKVASISAIHRLAGYPDPTKSAEVRLTMRKIERQLGNRLGLKNKNSIGEHQ